MDEPTSQSNSRRRLISSLLECQRQALLDHFPATMEDLPPPTCIDRVEHLPKPRLCRVIDAAGAIMMQAIFGPQRFENPNGMVCAEFLCREIDFGVREQAVIQIVVRAADLTSHTARVQ